MQETIDYVAEYGGRAQPYSQATIDALGLSLDLLTDLQSTTGMYIFELFIHGSMILVFQRCSVGSVAFDKLRKSDVWGVHCVEQRVSQRPQAPKRRPGFRPGPHALGALVLLAAGQRHSKHSRRRG